jgi:putative component of membrane protein insertase Oxa1/YidC/SpoIIIJ protein YidD
MLKLLSKVALTFLLMLISFGGFSQSDQDLLLNKGNAHKISFKVEKQERRLIQKLNPLYWVYTGMVNFYQRNISVQIAANCIFEETCSRYSKKLVNEKGIFGGIVLSIDRLSRCNKVTLAETSPLRFTKRGKVIEDIDEYNF